MTDPTDPRRGANRAFGVLGFGAVLLLIGSTIGLFFAPKESFMGDVYRIMYVHVPTAWNSLLAFTFAFSCAFLFLMKGDYKWDSRHEAALEVGIVLTGLMCIQGPLWAKPTWGVYWDWDPRLTTTAVMFFAFSGIIALRHFVEDPVKRATWSAVATIIAYADVPVVYFSVRWWNSLHQMQSSPETVSAPFLIPLRTNAFGVLFLMIGLIMLRSRIAAMRLEREMAPPLPAATAPALQPQGSALVTPGVVSGGWEYVIAAYIATAAILAGYTLSVLARYRAEAKRRDRSSSEGTR